MICRSYAVSAGDTIEDLLPVRGDIHVRVDGPNGFMRELQSAGMPAFNAEIRIDGAQLALTLANTSEQLIEVALSDKSYGDSFKPASLKPGQVHAIEISTERGNQWYDLSARAGETEYRFAGRVETGEWSVSDPAMG
jgi:phospholipase C